MEENIIVGYISRQNAKNKYTITFREVSL